MTEHVHDAVAQIITTRADGGNVVSDLIAAGSPSENAEDIFARVGTRISTNGRPMLGPRDSSGGPTARGGTGIRAGVVTDGRSSAVARSAPSTCPIPRPARQPPSPAATPTRWAASIRQRKGAFTSCYSKVITHDPSLAGKVVLMLDIAASGRIHHVEVREETLHSDELDACIEGKVSQWIFADLGCGETHIEFPLVFTLPSQ